MIKNQLALKNGELSTTEDYDKIKKEVLNEVKIAFKPEFLNRIDEIIVFHKLSENNLEQITNIMLDKVVKRMNNQGITIDITEEAKKLIINKGTDYKYGARPLRRTIQNLVEDKIADKVLSDNSKNIILDCDKGEMIVK